MFVENITTFFYYLLNSYVSETQQKNQKRMYWVTTISMMVYQVELRCS